MSAVVGNFDVRELVEDYDTKSIFQLKDGVFDVTFEDGVTKSMHKHQITMSRFYWDLHKFFDSSTIYSEHAYSGKFNADTHKNTISQIFYDIDDELNLNKEDFWALSREAFEVNDRLFNAVRDELGEYVTSMCIYDVHEIYRHPWVADIRAKHHENPKKVKASDVHAVVADLLFGDNEELLNNEIKTLAQAGIVRPGAIYQLIGPRGGVFDVNNKLFKYPIETGYYEGLNTTYDQLTESRSASRALMNTAVPLERSEVFNKICQNSCSVIKDYHEGSCVGFGTIEREVTKSRKTLLVGLNYMDNGKVKHVTKRNFDSLLGKTLSFRSMTKCNLEDTSKVCTACLGRKWKIIPPGSNLGHTMIVGLVQVLSQLLLSTKHYEADGQNVVFDLFGRMLDFLRKDSVDPGILYAKEQRVPKGGSFKMSFETCDATNLNLIMETSVDTIEVERISKIKRIWFYNKDANGLMCGVPEEFTTQVSDEGFSLTREMLAYIKANGWYDDGKTIEIDFKDFDFNTPVFNVPRRGDHLILFLNRIENFLNKELPRIKSIDMATQKLADILSEKMSFHMTSVEILIRCCMTTLKGGDNFYNIPRYSEQFQFMGIKSLLSSRTLSGMLSYDNPTAFLMTSLFYEDKPRMDHELDPLILP